MLTISTPIAFEKPIAGYKSDEIHITGKADGRPQAVLSFIPVDDTGTRLLAAPVAVVTLTGEAYNAFYAAWTSEETLYRKALALVLTGTPGAVLSGVDMSRLSSPADLSVSATPEVLNP